MLVVIVCIGWYFNVINRGIIIVLLLIFKILVRIFEFRLFIFKINRFIGVII